MTFSSPIQGLYNKVTQGWGLPRPHRDGTHEGFDFPAPIGTPVYAIGSGKVITSADTQDSGGAGKMISIEHANGIVSRYLHLDERLVQKGASVSQGQLIARSGASGIERSAAHLHFDLKVKPDKLASVWPWMPPVGGFPPVRYNLIGIPAEPFIPTQLTPAMQANAKKFGLGLYAGSSSILIALGVGVGSYLLYRRLS